MEQGTKQPHFSAYHISAKVWAAACGALGLATIAMLAKLSGDQVLSTAVKVWITVAALALFGTVLAWARRTATVTSPEGVAVRGLVRTRRIPWSQIQDIRIEGNPGAFIKKNAPDEMVVVSGGNGRRITLPHLNQKNLDGHGRVLGREVEAMRATWELLRGEDWAPMLDAAAETRYLMSSWMLGVVAMFAAAPIMVIVMTVGLVTGAGAGHGPVAATVFSPLGIPLGQFAACLATVAVSLVRRRRHRRAVTGIRAGR